MPFLSPNQQRQSTEGTTGKISVLYISVVDNCFQKLFSRRKWKGQLANCEMSGDLYKLIVLSFPCWSAELYCYGDLCYYTRLTDIKALKALVTYVTECYSETTVNCALFPAVISPPLPTPL